MGGTLFWVGGVSEGVWDIILGGWGWVGKYFGWVGVGALFDNAYSRATFESGLLQCSFQLILCRSFLIVLLKLLIASL